MKKIILMLTFCPFIYGQQDQNPNTVLDSSLEPVLDFNENNQGNGAPADYTLDAPEVIENQREATSTFANPAPRAKSIDLQINQKDLQRSPVVQFQGRNVPLIVLTELEKIAGQNNLSGVERDQFLKEGCIGFTKTIDTGRVDVEEIHIEKPIDVNIHEHQHTIEYAKKKYIYHYRINENKTISTSREVKILPESHEIGSIKVNRGETRYVQRPRGCHTKQVQQLRPATPRKVFIQQPVVRVQQPVCNNQYDLRFPRNTYMGQQMAGFFAQQRLPQTQVTQDQQYFYISTPYALQLDKVVTRYFPTNVHFARANAHNCGNFWTEVELSLIHI